MWLSVDFRRVSRLGAFFAKLLTILMGANKDIGFSAFDGMHFISVGMNVWGEKTGIGILREVFICPEIDQSLESSETRVALSLGSSYLSFQSVLCYVGRPAGDGDADR